jgi:hypothetical protein
LPFPTPDASVRFFCHAFCATAHAAHCLFLLSELIFKVKEKSQRAALSHEQKGPPKKPSAQLFNIMRLYITAYLSGINILCSAVHKSIMLNSTHGLHTPPLQPA